MAQIDIRADDCTKIDTIRFSFEGIITWTPFDVEIIHEDENSETSSFFVSHQDVDNLIKALKKMQEIILQDEE